MSKMKPVKTGTIYNGWGDPSYAEIIAPALGSVIRGVSADDPFRLCFDHGTLELSDTAEYCCESRYMTCDDATDDFVGAEFLGLEVADCADLDDGEVHEVQFLKIKTSLGDITVANHNEHNGYYGGFNLVARWMDK